MRRLAGIVATGTLGVMVLTSLSAGSLTAAWAADYTAINGAGSSWSANAIEQWRTNVKQYGMNVNFASTGSSDGRNQFREGTVDYAVSEIP